MPKPGALADHLSRSDPTAPILVGRATEQRLLRDLLAATMEGHGCLVLVGGEAGIGKTTLSRDQAREVTAHGALLLAGHCYDLAATPPYGPWLDLAARYRSDDALSPLPPVLTEGGIERVRSQPALFALILEDLHWADPARLHLLGHVAHRLPACAWPSARSG